VEARGEKNGGVKCREKGGSAKRPPKKRESQCSEGSREKGAGVGEKREKEETRAEKGTTCTEKRNKSQLE